MSLLLCNSDSAFDKVIKSLKIEFGVFYTKSVFNRGRHCILSPPFDSDLPKFYVVFKRSWFVTFNNKFQEFISEFPDMAGYGESINKEWLDLALQQRVSYFLFVHEEGSIYQVSPLLLQKFVFKHNLFRSQERRNDYRRADGSGGVISVNELTVCFPCKLLERWN